MQAKLIKKIIYILILFIINIAYFSNISFGATYTYTSIQNDLLEDFDTKYPGYKSLINTLVTVHPNWTFKLLETNLVWDTVINNEFQGHGYSPKNLVPANYSQYLGDWICPVCGTKPYDSGYWYCASRPAIEYMMDPRNSINETDIFQFQDLSTATADRVAIEKMVTGTFINNTECIDAIFTAATNYNISPYHLVARIIQEQGIRGSVLGLGITLDDGITYYNLFNVGASGNTSATVIANGVAKAKEKGWTSMPLAIIGGAEFVAKNYIAIGQNTLYFQKFNVVYTPSLYSHQYMQNLLAAQNEGISMRNKYINYGILESTFTFTIPLYLEMPTQAISRPLNTYSNLEEGELVTINSDPTLILRDAPAGRYLGAVINGTIVSRLEKATEKVDGYFWDKVSTPIGTGYMARTSADDLKTYLVPMQTEEEQEEQIDINYNNLYSEPENNIIKTEPNTTVNQLKETYKDAKFYNKNGEEITGDTLVGTGAKVKVDEETEYTIVKLGDVNGDGEVKSLDYIIIKNYIMEIRQLDEFEKKAADLSKDGEVKSLDYIMVKNHIMNTKLITLE